MSRSKDGNRGKSMMPSRSGSWNFGLAKRSERLVFAIASSILTIDGPCEVPLSEVAESVLYT